MCIFITLTSCHSYFDYLLSDSEPIYFKMNNGGQVSIRHCTLVKDRMPSGSNNFYQVHFLSWNINRISAFGS